MKRFLNYLMATIMVLATMLAACKKEGKTIHVTGVSLDKNTLILTVGDTAILIAIVLPENADNRAVAWKSNDTTVAKVNYNGLVTAVAKGTATITATTEDGYKTANCALTVNEKNNRPDPPHLGIEPVGELNFEYSAETKKAAINANIDWTASSTVDWITVTPTEGSGNDTLNVNVSANIGSGERSAEIIISQAGGESLSVTLEVKQKAVPQTPEQQPRKQDSLALVAFYNAANGDNWTNKTGWKTAPLEQWYGITLDNDRVIGIELRNNRLKGSIPPEIDNLSQLQVLSLIYNQLSGEIPAQIGNLIQLKELYLYENQLSGAIPFQIGNLIQLKELYLGENQLSGAIPVEICNLTQLYALDLGGNQLSGAIPPQIGNLIQLQWLYLFNNQLSGEVPIAILGKALSNPVDFVICPQQGAGFSNYICP